MFSLRITYICLFITDYYEGPRSIPLLYGSFTFICNRVLFALMSINSNQIKSNYKVETGDNWFRHKPMDVVLKKNIEIIYDQIITTSRPVGANRPDLIIKDVANKKAFIIDISCPVDTNVNKKEMEKLSKYGGLRVELERMWGVKAEIIPVIVGGLGAVTKNLADYLAKIPGIPDLHMCQKICLLGSKRILADVLKRK